MTIVFDLPQAQADKLRQEAARMGIAPSELARAAVNDLLSAPADDFQRAAERVLQKNAELYRRLA